MLLDTIISSKKGNAMSIFRSPRTTQEKRLNTLAIVENIPLEEPIMLNITNEEVGQVVRQFVLDNVPKPFLTRTHAELELDFEQFPVGTRVRLSWEEQPTVLRELRKRVGFACWVLSCVATTTPWLMPMVV